MFFYLQFFFLFNPPTLFLLFTYIWNNKHTRIYCLSHEWILRHSYDNVSLFQKKNLIKLLMPMPAWLTWLIVHMGFLCTTYFCCVCVLFLFRFFVTELCSSSRSKCVCVSLYFCVMNEKNPIEKRLKCQHMRKNNV